MQPLIAWLHPIIAFFLSVSLQYLIQFSLYTYKMVDKKISSVFMAHTHTSIQYKSELKPNCLGVREKGKGVVFYLVHTSELQRLQVR